MDRKKQRNTGLKGWEEDGSNRNNRSLERCGVSEPEVMDVILIYFFFFSPNAGNSCEELAAGKDMCEFSAWRLSNWIT